MAHGLVLRMQDYVKKIDTRKENTATAQESAYVPVDESDASSVEVVQIIKSWLLVTKNSRNSKMEFLSLLRETLLFMLSSNWANCTKQNDLLHVFGNYHQKFSTIVNKAETIKNAVLQLSNDPWGNPFFQWTELALGKLTVADRKVQSYFSQEPEEIVLARVQSFVLHNNLPSALGLAKLSFLYHSRIKRNLAKPSKAIGSQIEDISCEGHASIDWYMTLLERKRSLSAIIKEVSRLNCHEGVEIICRLKRNKHFNSLILTLVQIFIMQDLIKPSKHCCTKNLFDLFCLIHKERNSNVKEVTESIEKIFAAHAPSSSHLYLLVDVMWEKFGAKFFSLYIEFCIRGLTADINYLEIAKNEDLHCDKSELEVHIAKMFAKLSTLFSFYDEAKRDCMFSAFILKPSKSRHKYLQHVNRIIQEKQLEASENSNFDLPFRDCTCNRICNGYCKVPTCDNTFEHPLLKKGIRNVPFSLVEDLVSVLESVRCLKFQYNVFNWKFAGPKIANYFKSSLRSRNSISSVDSSQAKNTLEKVCNEDNKSLMEVDVTKRLLSPNALVKRKNSSDNSKSDFLDVGANIEVHSDDSSSKRIKISLPPAKETPEDSVSSICNLKISDAIEKVIRSSLNSDKTSREQTFMSMAPALNEPYLNNTSCPINITDKMRHVINSNQSPCDNKSVRAGANLVTALQHSYVSKPSTDSPPLKQGLVRPSVVMKAENLSDKKYIQPYESSKHSLLKSSLLKPDLHHKSLKDLGVKSNLPYKSEQFSNNYLQKSLQNVQLKQTNQMIDRNSNDHGAINLSSTRHLDIPSSKPLLEMSHQYPLDLKCNKKFEVQKTNRAIGTSNESVSNQNIHYNNQLADRLSNTPSVEAKMVDRNSVIQHTMQHLDIKIPKNLTVSIISDRTKQNDTSNLPTFKLKVPNRNLPKHNFVPANLVINRPLPSTSSTNIVSDKTSTHDKQEMITIPGILAPKSVIKRSWEVPSVQNNVEFKKIIHTSSTTKKTYCHPYQKQPVPVKDEWPREFISKTEKVTKRETTYQIYKTKQMTDNVNTGKWKTVGDVINSVQSPVLLTNPQLLSRSSVQSPVSSTNPEVLSRNSAQSTVSSSNSQLLSMNLVQSATLPSNSQLLSMNSVQSAVTSSNSQLLPLSYQNSNNSRATSSFSNNIAVHKSHQSNTQTTMSDFDKPSHCSYSYKNDAVSVPNPLQSKPSYNVKDNFTTQSELEKRSGLPVIGTSLLKTSLTSQSPLVRKHNSQIMQLLDYTNSKALKGSNTSNISTTTGTSPGLSVSSSNLNQRFQSNLSNLGTSYSLASVLVEDDKGIVYKAAKSENTQGHNTSSRCCSPSEVNPCQNCSLPPKEINFNSASTNAQIFNSPSVNVNSANQIKYEVTDPDEERELSQNQLVLQCPSQEEYTACHICSMTCSVANYQFHLEKHHSFETMKKVGMSSNIAKKFDLYDLQSTSFDSLPHDRTKEVSNVDPVENKTVSIDLPPNQNNINTCMGIINNSFDQVYNYLDNVESSTVYSDDSAFKFSDMLQSHQNNNIIELENNNSASGALEEINLESSFIENNICGNGSSLDEMLDFLDNGTDITQASQPSESLGPDKGITPSTPENCISNPIYINQLGNKSKIKKKLYCKFCLKTKGKERKFSIRGSLYKHVKTFHPDTTINDCLGHLVHGLIPSNSSSSQSILKVPDNRIVVRQSFPIVRHERSETGEDTFNNFQQNVMERNNFPAHNNANQVSVIDSIRYEGQFDTKNTFSFPERKTKHRQSKCVYCGKLLTLIYMKQHIAKMHPNALSSNLSSNNASTSVPTEFKLSLSKTSDLTQENIDSNTCLSVSDALQTGEQCNSLLNVIQKQSDFVNSSLIPTPKFVTNNEEHLGQDLNLNNFSSNSTHIFYTCHLCQRPYTSQSFLTKHIKTYHGIDDMNESAKSNLSYNEISDSSKFSDTNNSEPNRSLLEMPYENIPNSYGDYNYLENRLDTNLMHGDKMDAGDGYRNSDIYNCDLSNSEYSTHYKHNISDLKQLLQSGQNEHDTPNSSAENKHEYSNPLHTTGYKINQSNFNLHSLNNSIDTEQNSDLKNVFVYNTPNINTSAEIINPALTSSCEINRDSNFPLCSLTNFVDAEQKADLKNVFEHNIPNLNTTPEIKDSDPLHTTDCKINEDSKFPICSPNHSVESKQDADLNNVSETTVNYNRLPRFTCPICQKTYSGKAYFRKHFKMKHNRIASDKELEAWQNFSVPIKSRIQQKRISGVPVNNISDVTDLLSAGARCNEKVMCKICMKEYSCRGNLKIHLKNIHNRMVSDKQLEEWQKLSDSMKGRVKKKIMSEPVNQYTRRLSLEVQKSNYSGISDLLSAEARSNEKVECKICKKEYSCRGNLKIHMKNVHNYRGQRQRIVEGNKKEVQCHICLKLLQNTSLKQHVQQVHGDGFLTDEQEAFTVSNVAALSALNYCDENVQHTLSNFGNSNVSNRSDSVTFSSGKSSTGCTENEPESLNLKDKASNYDCLNSLKKMADFGKADFSSFPSSNNLQEVTNVSSHKTSIETFNCTASKLGFDSRAVNDFDLQGEITNQNVADDRSDFDDFSLSDIPTSDDECTNLIENEILQKELMEIGTTSEWTLKNFQNCEDQNFTSLESNHSLEPISDVTDTSRNDISECKFSNNESKRLSVVENYPKSNIVSELSESCEPFKEVGPSLSVSTPEAAIEFNFVEGSNLDRKGEKLHCTYPLESCPKPDNVCAIQSSTDDEFSVPLEKFSDANSPQTISCSFSSNESKTNSNECRFCHKMFSTMKFLSKHLKIFHNIPFLKKQKSAKRKSNQDEKLSPPLLTHQTYELDTLPPSVENFQNSAISAIEDENKFVGVSDEVYNYSDSLPVDNTNQLNNCSDGSLMLNSTFPISTSNLEYSLKEVGGDFRLKQCNIRDTELACYSSFNDCKNEHMACPVSDRDIEHRSFKVSDYENECTSHPVSDSESNYALDPILDHENDCTTLVPYQKSHCISDRVSALETDYKSLLVSDHENECATYPVSEGQENIQDKISKAPILPCIIKVLKNEKNAIIYQIDKSKGDDSPSNSVNSKSKSSPGFHRYFIKHKKSNNSRNCRKKSNRSPYRSSLYSRQKTLMRRKSRALFTRRNKIFKRSRKKRDQPVVQTFKPSDVEIFLKNHKLPYVLLTPLDAKTLSQLNYNDCAVRLERCDILNIESPAHFHPGDVTELSFSNDSFMPNEAYNNIQINSVMKTRRNSAVQETTNLTVVLHKLQLDSNSSEVPLNNDFEISSYRSCVQSHIQLKECKVVLEKLPSDFVSCVQ
ncbi:uncharacterized protein [Parasteatoda tepidariorum]|uniref:uncharacterized protein isoform X2 n=1 Tax=Parasteatoda tepidariorum TaxID=114398 RepID=UPI001C720B6E|nr:uncharacterized protein LOC107438052 isoform X2 [Parasteatoda tepidariorum]